MKFIKEMINELENIVVETIQKKKRKNGLKPLTEHLWPVGDNTCNWKSKRKERKKIFHETTIKNFPEK